jgi:hydroxymethylbilane synthase
VTSLRIGSRGSQLALFQARLVAQRIVESGGPAPEIIVIRTSGDQLADRPLSEIGGKRLFVKEIEDALLRHEIDLAVHSSKDMPAELPAELAIAAVLPREDPADALVLPLQFADTIQTATNPLLALRERLGAAARIGTGSVRRIAQLMPLFPGARFENIRGNLDTRLHKLDAGGYDVLVLAAAGLRRLGLQSRISVRVPFEECIPAPGQGIIAVETRADDNATRGAVAAINDANTWAALEAERALVTALGGGCQMPIGGVAVMSAASDIQLHAIVASLDGGRAIRYKKVGTRAGARELGRQVAEHLLQSGAEDILRDARHAESQVPNH